MVPGGSPLLQPQIQPSADGARASGRRSPCLHLQIQASEEDAGETCRRSRRASPAAPESLPNDDDMLREILTRLPPQPSSLPRASAVCKRWLGLVTDPKFHRQFYAHHRKPPLLGFFQDIGQGIEFIPILDHPDRIPPVRFDLGCSGHQYLLDCRHGLVLMMDSHRNEVVVCDPITGELRKVAVPSVLIRSDCFEGAVLCTAGDHGDMHLSSYKVLLVSITKSDILACVYSLETAVWGDLVSTKGPHDHLIHGDHVPAALVGNCLYWPRGDHILEFDLGRHLAVIMGPPDTDTRNRQIIQAADGALGYAILGYPLLEMWHRHFNDHGVGTWVLSKTIKMHTIIRLPFPDDGPWVQLLGYDEDDVVSLCYAGTVYMVQLKSMQSKKLNGFYHRGTHYFPFKSFFTPAIAGGFNGAKMLHIG